MNKLDFSVLISSSVVSKGSGSTAAADDSEMEDEGLPDIENNA